MRNGLVRAVKGYEGLLADITSGTFSGSRSPQELEALANRIIDVRLAPLSDLITLLAEPIGLKTP